MEIEYSHVARCIDIFTLHLPYSVGLSKTCFWCTRDEAAIAYDALKTINDHALVSVDTSRA